jgi:hypothetical protein
VKKTRISNFKYAAALQALTVLGAGVAAVIATPAMAQDYTNINASGRVQGTNGEVISGATVTVTSNDQGFTRTLTTDSNGSFRVSAIPPGVYTITISADGFETYTEGAVSLTQSSSANQFTLTTTGSAASEEIVVTAGRIQVVDFNRNTTGAVISVADVAERVPVARDITSVVLLAPGTAAGDNAFGNLPSIAGASVSENAYYINGLNITNFRDGLGSVAVPFDFYDTVEVKNGGISAEFGRTTGGFINATTKSGSNTLHGGITVTYAPDSLSSDSPNTYATDNDSVYSERKDFVAQLSGPIIKDHLFFYGIYQSRDVQTAGGFTGAVSATGTGANGCATNPTMCVAFPALPAAANQVLSGTQYNVNRSRSPFYGAKIDAIIVDGQRLEFTYFNTESLNTRDIFGTSLFSLASGNRYNPNTNAPGSYASTTLFRSGGENYVGRYTGSFTDWLTVSAAYGRNKDQSTTESSTPNASSIIDQRSGAATQVGNPTANTSTAFDQRTFYRADVDLYVNLLGEHHFRAGYDREDLENTSATLANGNYQLTYLNSGAAGNSRVPTPNTTYVTRRFFRNGGFFTTKGEAFYLQDSWTLFSDRLQLNLGIRNDKFINKNADGDTFYDSGDLWAPRLGFSADPFGEGRTKVYGSFGRYYLPVATNTNVRLAGPELDYTGYFRLTGTNPDGTPIYGAPIAITGTGVRTCPSLGLAADQGVVANCTVNSDGTTPPFASLVDSKLKAQSRDEYIFGVEQRLGSRWKVGGYFTYRKLNESLEDAYIDQGVVAYCNRELTGAGNAAKLASCLDTWSGFHQYALLNPGKDVTLLLDGVLAGETEGRTVTLKAADLLLPQAKATYKAFTFTFDREFDGKWGVAGSYTYADLKGNIEGGVRSDNGQTDSGLTTAFDLPGLVDGAYGFLPPHRKHNFKLYGSYQLLEGLTFGGNVQITSPRKFGCIGRAPTNADGGLAEQYGAAAFYCNVDPQGNVITTGAGINTNNSGKLTPRGSLLNSDWLYNIGLDVAYKLPTELFDGTIRLSVFNVLNSKAKLDFQEVGTTAAGAPLSLYGQPLQYQAGRSARIQFGVNF